MDSAIKEYAALRGKHFLTTCFRNLDWEKDVSVLLPEAIRIACDPNFRMGKEPSVHSQFVKLSARGVRSTPLDPPDSSTIIIAAWPTSKADAATFHAEYGKIIDDLKGPLVLDLRGVNEFYPVTKQMYGVNDIAMHLFGLDLTGEDFSKQSQHVNVPIIIHMDESTGGASLVLLDAAFCAMDSHEQDIKFVGKSSWERPTRIPKLWKLPEEKFVLIPTEYYVPAISEYVHRYTDFYEATGDGHVMIRPALDGCSAHTPTDDWARLENDIRTYSDMRGADAYFNKTYRRVFSSGPPDDWETTLQQIVKLARDPHFIYLGKPATYQARPSLSLRYAFRFDEDQHYVAITSWSHESAEFKKGVFRLAKFLRADSLAPLVIDIRNNMGGYDELVNVMTTLLFGIDVEPTIVGYHIGQLSQGPITILFNELSFSASLIFLDAAYYAYKKGRTNITFDGVSGWDIPTFGSELLSYAGIDIKIPRSVSRRDKVTLSVKRGARRYVSCEDGSVKLELP